MDIKDKKILVTGGAGFLGSHVVTKLLERGVPKKNIVVVRSSEHDLRIKEECEKVVEGIDLVFHLSAKVGGIGFNQENPGALFYDNIIMGAHMIDAAYRAGIKKFLVVGTVCSYPKSPKLPFREDDIWSGYPEETNAPYGLAKKALMVQARAYREEYGFNTISLIPVNLYGPGDNFDPKSSHVIPALIKRIAEAEASSAPSIEVWGTGKPTREFLYVDDAAEGIVAAMERYDKPDPVNLGSGSEISIEDLVAIIADGMKYKGAVQWNTAKPDGQPRRVLDISRAEKEFGFTAKTDFRTGLRNTIDWYLAQQ
jgi:GDP-L-fucose synthase